ncbi:hypothetical protein CLU83_0082 [Flavobacterium sp. 1]|uniref:YobI family P-loop NTPase n=1 Tax=Flavobacterium sp. 1 TaxID=2035200 RepID=UPI000C23349F|nr:hypothetical protein [Flavobacterium sp. 1]PJJ06959.1 hypothetical protein CLU83_0082 [Flavobacterium sp. 1]
MTNNTIQQKLSTYTKEIKLNTQKWYLKKLIISKYRLEKKLDRIKIVKIENFTPKILSSREDNHSALLNEIIQNKNIFNIALTGPYGSGKTSIIRTFEHNFSNLNFINISLATFDGKVIKDDKTSKLEYSILKQIFYKVSHDKVPQSRFKRIVNHKHIYLKTGLLFFWISSIIYLSDFDLPDSLLTTKLVHTLWLKKLYAEYLDLLCSVCAIAGAIYFLNMTYDFFVNFKIGKLKISEAELDNKNDSKTIDFENEIDEILYFFDKNKTDVVFIEDLDRFDNTEIYIKLREINCLINNYQPIKKRGKVTFVYAVRDNMFDETERTKFFDIILPVIPVINYTNSSDKFLGALALNLNQISDLEEKSKFKDFIEVVSRYINDMRTIISICNEFKIYEKILGGSGIDKIKLLAMMIYKNIEPSDFDCLDKNKGYVYQLFKNKKDLINTEIVKIVEEIRLIEDEKIKESERESFESINELRKFYLYTFINLVNKTKKQIVVKIRIGNDSFDEDVLLEDDNFEKFSAQTNIQYVYQNSSNDNTYTTESSLSFKVIENAVNKKLSYKKRTERIKNKEKEELTKLRKERQDLLAKQESIISKRLSEILITQESNNYFITTFNEYFTKPTSTTLVENLPNQSNIEFKCVYNHKINNKDLIDFLIREGHIDENYERFISKYNGSHKENQTFLLSLSNRKALAFDYKIKDISALIKDIKTDCFHQKEILNFYLMDYLLERKSKTQLDSIFITLKDESKNSVSFIDRYLDFANDINKQHFLNGLIQHWKQFYNFISKETSYLPEKYIRLIFKNLTTNHINEVNIDNNLASYICQMSDLNCIYFNDANRSKVEEFLKNTNIRFEKLNYNQEYKHLIDFIYENSLYEINAHMVELFVNLYKVNDIELENLKTSNFTTIQKSGCKKLIEYVNQNIFDYIECVYFELKDNIDEDENSIITLLNTGLIEEVGLQMIEKNQTIISEVSKINDKALWSKLFEYNRLEISWENFFKYFKEFDEIDETLVNYLNDERVSSRLSEKKMTEIDEDSQLLFSELIIKSKIGDDSFKALAKQFPYIYNMNELIEVSLNKIKILIEHHLIKLDKNNFETLNNQYPQLIILFIKNNKQDFLNIYQELELNSSIIKELLRLSESAFTNVEKIEIIENTEEIILTGDKELLKELCKFLYNKEKININEVILNCLLSSSIEEIYRVTVFNIYYSKSLSLNVLNVRIKSLKQPYDFALGRKHLKLNDTSYNRLFCQNLKDRYVGEISERQGMLTVIPKSIKK